MRTAFIMLSCLLATDLALAQQAAVVADLASIAPVTLSKTDLAGLLPNAKVTRIIANGNKHIWTNDSDGTFIVSSDNRATNGHTSTGQGKWHLSDDGRSHERSRYITLADIYEQMAAQYTNLAQEGTTR